MSLTIRAAEPADFPRVRDMLRSQYPHSLKSNEMFFDWRFGRNPLGGCEGGYFLAIKDGEIIGQLATIADSILIGGEWRPCVWLCDLIVKPEYRSGRAALQLLSALISSHEIVFFIGVCPHMVDTYRLLRAVEIPVLQTYLSVIRPGPLLRLASAANSLSGKSKLLGPLLSMAGAALPIMHRFRASLSRRRRSPVSVEPLRAFDREVDDFLEKVLPELGITCRRSSEQLRWKFDQRPFGEHIALAARDRETGQLRGYAVTKIMQREGVARWAEVADVVAAPNDAEAFRMLLAESHYLAAERDVDFVRMRCSHPAFKPRLPFWLRHTRPIVDSLFVSCQNDQIRALMQSSHWHLTAMSSALVDYGEDELSSVGAVAAAANVGVSHA